MLIANRVINARWKFGLNSRSSDQAVINVTWRCSGRELRLLSCTQVSTTQSTCTDAGVYCYGKLKLIYDLRFSVCLILKEGHMTCVKMVSSDLLVEIIVDMIVEEWRSALMGSGGQCVMMDGT